MEALPPGLVAMRPKVHTAAPVAATAIRDAGFAKECHGLATSPPAAAWDMCYATQFLGAVACGSACHYISRRQRLRRERSRRKGVGSARVAVRAAKRQAAVADPPSIDETLIGAYAAGVRATSGEATMPATSSGPGPNWTIVHDEALDGGSTLYSQFCIKPVPHRQGRIVGNMLRRTLMRQDLFRSYAPVAMRVSTRPFHVRTGGAVEVDCPEDALHEFDSVRGIHESMIDVVRNAQDFSVAWRPKPTLPLTGLASNESGSLETWRWVARLCGPCVVQARDLQIVDSASHYETPLYFAEPQQHLLRVTVPVAVEIELEVACCSQVEWGLSRRCLAYQEERRQQNWLMIPPIFSPVRKVNFGVTALEGSKTKEEIVHLEVWTRPSEKPSSLVRAATTALMAALTNRPIEPDEHSGEDADDNSATEAGGSDKMQAKKSNDPWAALLEYMPAKEALIPSADPTGDWAPGWESGDMEREPAEAAAGTSTPNLLDDLLGM